MIIVTESSERHATEEEGACTSLHVLGASVIGGLCHSFSMPMHTAVHSSNHPLLSVKIESCWSSTHLPAQLTLPDAQIPVELLRDCIEPFRVVFAYEHACG